MIALDDSVTGLVFMALAALASGTVSYLVGYARGWEAGVREESKPLERSSSS